MCERYRPYSFDTRFFENARGLMKRCSRCFNVVNENCKFVSLARVCRESSFHVCAPRVYVERRLGMRRARAGKEGSRRNIEDYSEVSGDEFRLVESAFALPARVERNGYENRARGRKDTEAQKVISENLWHHGRKRADTFVFERVNDFARGFRLIGKRREKV